MHYNFLHFAITFQKQNVLIPPDWELMKEPILKKIIDSGKVSKAIIIICKLAEIKKRIRNRIYIEQKINPGKYPMDLWKSIYLRLFNYEYLISQENKIFQIIQDINLVKEYLNIDTNT